MNLKHVIGIVVALSLVVVPGSLRGGYPPDPDNAALLYYQAFLLSAQLEAPQEEAIGKFARGQCELTDEIREAVAQCHTAIDYTVAASGLRECNWGFRFSLGFNASMPHLAQVRLLSRAILAEARIRAADGAWREAFERCLVVKKMGYHVGDDTLISMLVAMAVDGSANARIRDFLGQMPKGKETLQWLKAELAMLSGRLPTAERPMEYEMAVSMEIMQPEKRDALVGIFEGTDVKITPEHVAKMDEEFLAKNRESYAKVITSVAGVLTGPGTYEQRYRKLRQLADEMDGSDESTVLAKALTPGFASVFNRFVLAETEANVTRAAVDVYLARVESGRLPRTLPTGLPNEGFSGRDFAYERTDNGFVLRCQTKDLHKDTVHEYAFTAK